MQVGQFIYQQGSSENSNTIINIAKPWVKFGIKAPVGTKFKFNDSIEITIGRFNRYDSFPEIGPIKSCQVIGYPSYFIIDYLYKEQKEEEI